MRQDYRREITQENVSALIGEMINEGYEVEEAQGVLNDEYYIDDVSDVGFSRGVKPRKHLAILATYLNPWADKLEILLTDDTDKYMKLKEQAMATIE